VRAKGVSSWYILKYLAAKIRELLDNIYFFYSLLSFSNSSHLSLEKTTRDTFRVSPRDSSFLALYFTIYLTFHKDYTLYEASHSNRLSI
jgi:hypothetical protein